VICGGGRLAAQGGGVLLLDLLLNSRERSPSIGCQLSDLILRGHQLPSL
jgi:hypothetical protein